MFSSIIIVHVLNDNIELIKKYIKNNLILLFQTLITNTSYKLSSTFGVGLRGAYDLQHARRFRAI